MGKLDAHMQKRDWDLTLPTKNNSKWITDLNIKYNTIKLLEENTGEKSICDLGFGDEFLDTTPKAQSTKKNGQSRLY